MIENRSTYYMHGIVPIKSLKLVLVRGETEKVIAESNPIQPGDVPLASEAEFIQALADYEATFYPA